MNGPLLLLAIALQAGPLTLDEAVDTALANHPDIKAANSQTEAALARARESRAGLLPQARLSAGYDLQVTKSPDLPTDTGDRLSSALSADVLLWDFGRTSNRWRASKASAASVAHDADTTVSDLVLQTRLAFLGVLEAQALVVVGRETLANEERHLGQIEQFVQAGTRPSIDLAKLRTTVASARAAVVRAEGNLSFARAQLAQTMGTPRASFEVAESSLPALEVEESSTDQLFSLASEQRPELASRRSSIEAQELEVRIADKQLWPALKLGTAASYSADGDFFAPGLGATVGLTLSWTIFDGLAAPAAQDAARATLDVERARLSGREQQIWTELEQARVELAASKAELEAARQGLGSAQELLQLAEARYSEGVGDAIELSDAQLELANARSQEVRAQYGLASARASLLKAIGRRDWR